MQVIETNRLTRPSGRRALGLGSVFGKTVRDSLLAVALVAGLLCTIIVAGGVTMATTYGTAQSRAELAAMSSTLPDVMRGLYGNPLRVDTLGGFISWHYGAYFALLAGLWSIVALSSTLAAEARRGTLDFTLSAPLSRRRVTGEKVLGHLGGLALVTAAVAIATWLTGIVGSTFAGDEIAPAAAVAFAVGLAVKALLVGAVAFALAPLLGRGPAAGIAGGLMLGSYVVQGYRTIVPALDQIAPLSLYSWTADHLPLAGQSDWPSVAWAGIIALALLLLGIELFVRRDVGTSTAIPGPSWPSAIVGVSGPLRRSFGDLLPASLAWGIGLGLYGLVMAGSARAFSDMLTGSPGLVEAIRRLIPEVDLTTTAGFLQFAFTELGFILIGLATTTLVAIRASDETAGRLELQLATPLTRARWTISSTIAVWLAVAVLTAILAISIGVGVASAGEEASTPAAGTLVLGLYAAALAGIGVAVGGVFRPSLAAPVVFGVAVATFIADVLAPVLGLPDWVAQLALTAHLGRPMIGAWDAFGVIACLALAAGGLAVGVWGMRRRDVTG